MTTTPNEIACLFERYGAAWNRHDLDAIMAEHAPDCIFHLHAGGAAVTGITAVREAFAASLAQWPGLHFTADDVRMGADHVTSRWTGTITLAPGRELRFDAVDVIVIAGGRIARKDTYVDSQALQQQLAALAG